MEALGLDNIFGEQEIDNLFGDSEETLEETREEPKPHESENGEKHDETTKTTEVVKPEDLFEDEGTKQPESVGSEKDNEGKGDAATDGGSDTSPNFYSSIANALAVDGIFPNLDEESFKKVNDAESLSELIDAEVKARFDEGQRRVLQALENGVEPNSIRQYEGTLNYLNSVTDTMIADESDKGEELRQRIIYQDFLNKGYKPAKAQQLTQRTIDAGTDVEDAKEALQSNKEYYQEEYDKLLDKARKEAEQQKADRQKQEAKLKKSILEDKDLMGDMELSADVRKKVYENISRPIYKDPETGQYLTALQKYEMEHHDDFIKYVGLFMTLTDGFKDFKSFAKAEVRKEMKKGLRELEQALNNTRRDSGGNLDLLGSRKNDPESFLSGGFKLAL